MLFHGQHQRNSPQARWSSNVGADGQISTGTSIDPLIVNEYFPESNPIVDP